jgi:hypothetical protein
MSKNFGIDEYSYKINAKSIANIYSSMPARVLSHTFGKRGSLLLRLIMRYYLGVG